MDKEKKDPKIHTMVLLVQLGSPQDPSTRSIRAFLKEFLGDPRVVDWSPWAWKLILFLFVLPWRPKRVSRLYQKIWNGQSFPLITHTKSFARKVNLLLESGLATGISVEHSFLLSQPRIENLLSQDHSFDQLLIIPQFPQYAEATTASVFDAFSKCFRQKVNIPSFTFLNQFYRSKAFIDQSSSVIEEYLTQAQREGRSFDLLILSFHGVPWRRITEKRDLYYKHCWETFLLIKNNLPSTLVDPHKIQMTFQSRFGQEEWTGPSTEDHLLKSIHKGCRRVAIYCPSFVADCLETQVEIGHELREVIKPLNAELELIPCLNDRDSWCSAFAQYLNVFINGNFQEKEQLYYPSPSLEGIEETKAKEILMKNESSTLNTSPTDNPMEEKQVKKILKILFLTLFLDLIGFTIIFPMFPALAKYYLTVDADNPLLKMIFSSIALMTSSGGADNSYSPIVLFGGVLGSLYSFLQFLFAPFWGKLSDRIGRRPVLIFSLVGMTIGHLLWIFSGSFTLLLLSRFLGGVMSGNISTATAVVADITTPQNRAKGMATIGIAFALGFIIGPAIGGILTHWNFLQIVPEWQSYGINPFSLPAAFAFLLSAINLFSLLTSFKETLPAKGVKSSEAVPGSERTERTANPFSLFRPFPFKGVNMTNFGYFFFLTAFSGMEFTLTFLAVERFHFTSMQNAYMFIFIGVLIVLIQGGVVRRRAATVGEKKMALSGLILLLPGLLLLAFTQSTMTLYLGLFFLAIGSALTIPCLTTLISLYTPADVQGQVIGVFRSLGALGRVIGPLVAAFIYWKWGSSWPYTLGAIFLIIPILMVASLPQTKGLSHKD